MVQPANTQKEEAQMGKDVLNKIRTDIENAERFFDRTGEDISEAYKFENPDIDKVNKNGVQNVFLYIPDAYNDVYAMFLN